jgi:hypothetical protein
MPIRTDHESVTEAIRQLESAAGWRSIGWDAELSVRILLEFARERVVDAA